MNAKVQLTAKSVKRFFNLKSVLFLSSFAMMMIAITPASAHCDSYDGPVIKEALRALDTNNVELVYKWIAPDQEKEISSLFNKAYSLKDGDKELYSIVERHFLETLVRLHRETEGAPFTGIKPEGSMTPVVQMADNAIETNEVATVTNAVTNHLAEVIQERYEKVMELSKTKDNSVSQGREYVEAYVVYTHTLEAVENLLHGDHSH